MKGEGGAVSSSKKSGIKVFLGFGFTPLLQEAREEWGIKIAFLEEGPSFGVGSNRVHMGETISEDQAVLQFEKVSFISVGAYGDTPFGRKGLPR